MVWAMTNHQEDIGIIGGGFTGYAVLLNILDRAIQQAQAPDHTVYDITIYNPESLSQNIMKDYRGV